MRKGNNDKLYLTVLQLVFKVKYFESKLSNQGEAGLRLGGEGLSLAATRRGGEGLLSALARRGGESEGERSLIILRGGEGDLSPLRGGLGDSGT